MRVVIKPKKVADLTVNDLNNAIEGLILFNDDKDIPDIVHDVYALMCRYQKAIEKGTLSKFNMYDYIDGESVKEVINTDVNIRKHINILVRIPLRFAFGNNPIEKVANLLYNIKIFSVSITDGFLLNFRGYETGSQIDEAIKGNSESNSAIMEMLTGNIRRNICDLSLSMLTNLYDREVDSVDDMDPMSIPIALVTQYYLTSLEEVSDQKVLASKTVKDREGEDRMLFRASKASDLKRVRSTDLAKGNVPVKLMKGELSYVNPVKYVNAIQAFEVLCDDSGSMNNRMKQTRVRMIMSAILSKVLDGKATVNFNYYGFTAKTTMTANDKQSTVELRNRIYKNMSNENGTDIGASLQVIIDRVASKTDVKEPHVIIILDGDDTVYPERVDTKGVTISAFLLGKENAGIKALCDKTGGFMVEDRLYEKYFEVMKD